MLEQSSRLGYTENAVAQLLRDLADLRRRVAAVEQTPWGAGGGGDGGTQSPAGYFGCTLSAPLTHGHSLVNQTVWQINPVGTRSNVTTTGTVYHDGPTAASDLNTGDQAILAANPDGTYAVIGRYCL